MFRWLAAELMSGWTREAGVDSAALFIGQLLSSRDPGTRPPQGAQAPDNAWATTPAPLHPHHRTDTMGLAKHLTWLEVKGADHEGGFLYNSNLAPVPPHKRKWTSWTFFIFWWSSGVSLFVPTTKQLLVQTDPLFRTGQAATFPPYSLQPQA